MKLTYIGGHDSVDIPLPYGGVVVAQHGETVEVPDSLGESLLLQESNYQPADKAAKRSKDEKPVDPADGGDV